MGQHVAKLDGGQLLQTPGLVQGIGAEDVVEDVFDLRLQRFRVRALHPLALTLVDLFKSVPGKLGPRSVDDCKDATNQTGIARWSLAQF